MSSQARILKHFYVAGLHGCYDLELDLNDDISILHGKNGTGKTTILHMIANILELDFDRFRLIRFDRIRALTSDNSVIELIQHRMGDSIAIELCLDGTSLGVVDRETELNSATRRLLREKIGNRPVYLPAFRSVLESVASRRYAPSRGAMDANGDRTVRDIVRNELDYENIPHEVIDRAIESQYSPLYDKHQPTAFKTIQCREWFGGFVPLIRFPSIREAAFQVAEEFQSAQLALARSDREAFSDVFIRVLDSVLSELPNDEEADFSALLEKIHEHLALLKRGFADQETYNAIINIVGASKDRQRSEVMASKILAVYEKVLRERVFAREDAFKRINTFLDSVNEFLEGKSLSLELIDHPSPRHRQAIRVTLENGNKTKLETFSSGERHIFTMLFSATHMSSSDGILLIDEPELSLHVTWQRKILKEIMRQAGNRQVIVCTHAPEVVVGYREHLIDIRPTFRSEANDPFDQNFIEIEE